MTKSIVSAANISFIPATGNDVPTWARIIKRHLSESISEVVSAGQNLDLAVADFKQQASTATNGAVDNPKANWKNLYGELLDEIGISRQTAANLRAIGMHPALKDSRIHHALPSSWTTLRELAKLEAPVIRRAVKSGKINPQMKGKDAKAFRGEPKATRPPPKKASPATESSLDMAHDVYLELPKKRFLSELMNLISDHRSVKPQDIIDMLQESI